MVSSQWQCKQCGRVGGFILKGRGFVKCSGCGTWFIVGLLNQLHPIPKAEWFNEK